MQKTTLLIIATILVQLIQGCGKSDTPIDPQPVIPQPSKVTFDRIAIEEFWPLSEGKIDEASKTITIRVPYWAKLSDLSVYSQLNLGTESAASVTITPSLSEKVDFTTLKTIKITDGQGKKAEYTLKIEKPEIKLVTSIMGEDEFNFSYDAQGKMTQVKSFNQNPSVNGGKVATQAISYNSTNGVDLSTQNSAIGQVYTTKDNGHTVWLKADEKKRIKDIVKLAEETTRLEYDIPNKKIYLYFRVNPQGNDDTIMRKMTFSDFDGNFSPMSTLPLQETHWAVNLTYSLFHYYFFAPTTIAPKLLLSNPKTILTEELWGSDKKKTTINVTYEYQNNLPIKYTADTKVTTITYQ